MRFVTSVLTMISLMHRMLQMGETVLWTSSSFAALRPDCGQIQAKGNPSYVAQGPPGT